jgi:type IV fimbrial biogenesis protein FimT
MAKIRGITLVELLVVLTILAILAAGAVPWLGDLWLDARRSAAVNELVHAFHFARQDANRGARDVVICRSTDGERCAPAGPWQSGWLVFLNRDGDDPPVRDTGEPILKVAQRADGLRITSNRYAWILRPSPLRATNGTLVICDRRGPRAARAVIVSYTGRPRLATRSAAGRPLTCPP